MPPVSAAAIRIGQNVAAARAKAGVTREIVAEATGHDVGTIARVERGEVDARISTLVAIAGALGSDLAEFTFGVTPDMVPTREPRSESRRELRRRRRSSSDS